MREKEDNDREDVFYFYIILISITILITSFIVRFVYLPAKIVGISMENTLSDGNILAYSTLAKEVRGINRGDIVAIKAKVKGSDIHMVKRVIALPGDNIKILDKMVFINGQVLDETYIKHDFSTEGHVDIDLEEDYYFVMGDNREQSMDSRDYSIGPIKGKNIIGIVVNSNITSKRRDGRFELPNVKEDILEEFKEDQEFELEIPEGFFKNLKVIE